MGEFAGEGSAIIQSSIDGVDEFIGAWIEIEVGELLLKFGDAFDPLLVGCQVNGLQILEGAQGFIEFGVIFAEQMIGNVGIGSEFAVVGMSGLAEAGPSVVNVVFD